MFINTDKPVGHLHHKPTKSCIAVFKPIKWFHALMLKWCFGLNYESINNCE